MKELHGLFFFTPGGDRALFFSNTYKVSLCLETFVDGKKLLTQRFLVFFCFLI